ncbi:hypothetical protein N1851_032733 [Merluccius polli]|uniref:CCHC-type domain-containing protein n=1 Tax=Merluccius polli TaxID=89951 RepID=A0AA47M2K3_MERPO|nr:hypothetical protein N1851_032733 [Merluccius polli]
MEGGGDGALPAAAPPAPVIAAGPCATFNIQPPESFDFSRPQEWDKWIRRFERFRLASNLNSSSEDNQVNTLIYCMGDEADDILRGLTLSADQRRTYQGVRDGLQGFFVVKKNVIYERAKFNMRNQREGESVDLFVTALYALAEHCSYAMLHNELIRDRIVVGLQDKGLSERMQLDADLTLDKAIRMARQSEEVKRQQFSLRGDTRSEAMFKSNFKSAKNKPQYADSQKQKPHSTQYSKDKGAQSQCQNCGNSPFHQKSDCPANDVKCHACGRRGHYKRVCKSKYVHEVEEDEDEEEIFLGSVTTEGDPWMVNIDIHESSVTFKIDTGADVTVLPYTVFLNTYRDNPPMLRKATKPLLGPGRSPLDVVGVARLILRRGEKEEREDVYIARHVHTALLGRAVSCRLGLVARLDRKCLWTADTLSRAPVEREENPADKELFEDTNIYVDMVLENLPASADYLEELREQLRRDSVATPLDNGYSPAQLLMGRRLRTTVPTLPALLNPALPDREAVMQKEGEKRIKDAQRYNLRHRAQNLDRLNPGQDVWIKDQRKAGAIIGSHSTPRSYLVEGPHGTIRRNRRHLVPMRSSPEQSGCGAAEPFLGGVPEPPSAEPPQQSLPETPSTPTPRTRSGRAVVRPTRLDL